MERIFVSGSSSFVGTYVQKELVKQGYKIKKLSRSFVDNPDQSEIGAKSLEESTLLYFGWYSNRYPDYQLNSANFLWLERATKAIEFAKKKGMKIVIPGSSAEYLTLNDSPYVQSKRELLERLRTTEVDYMWPRLFYVFSLSELRPTVMREAHEKYSSKDFLTLRSPYDGQDFIEVRDVASQIVKALQLQLSGEVDVGTGRIHKTQDLVKKSFPELTIVFGDDTTLSSDSKCAIPAKVDTRLFSYEKSYTFQHFERE